MGTSGSWKKGQSGNPGGRSKASAAMARLIREATREGAELVEFAIGVLRDAGQTEKSRQWAVDWLSDRGFGKPLQAVDLSIDGDMSIESRPIDLSTLTVAQLEALASIKPTPILDTPPAEDDGDTEH